MNFDIFIWKRCITITLFNYLILKSAG